MPRAPGVARYGRPAVAEAQGRLRPEPLRDAVLEDVRRAARSGGRPAPDEDARLHVAMNELARIMRDTPALPPLEVVDFLLGHHGVVEAAPHVLLVRGSPGSDREIRASLASQIPSVFTGGPMAQVGVGVDRTATALTVVVALQERHLDLDPVPRVLALGATAPLHGKLHAGHGHPAVLVTGPDGLVRELSVAPARPGEGGGAGASFRAVLRCDRAGIHQVEVTGNGPRGTEVLANFPVFCGVEPPRAPPRLAAVRPTTLTVAEAERRMLELVNRDRRAAGLKPVQPDGRLADVARAHSRDMVSADYVGHVSPSTGNALDRARRAGLDPQLLLENIARGYSPEEAQAGLMMSPGHRANILHPQAQRIGIGIAFGPSVAGNVPMLVTQLFL